MKKYTIAHFGDVHVHNDKYHEKYREVFDKIYSELYTLKPNRIVIAGDLYVSFVKISNEAEELAGEFLNNLSKISKVIIVAGNHDIQKSRKDKLNSVELLVKLLGNDNIVYYDRSAV